MFKQEPLFLFIGMMRIRVGNHTFNHNSIVQRDFEVMNFVDQHRQDKSANDLFSESSRVHPFIIMRTVQFIPRLIIVCCDKDIVSVNNTAESHRMKNEITFKDKL